MRLKGIIRMRKKQNTRKKLDTKKLIDSLKEKYGELEVEGHYGEQCKPEEALDILLEMLFPEPTPREVWESSKRVLDEREVN